MNYHYTVIDESLCDTFLDEKPNKQFSSEKQKDKAVVFHFVASGTITLKLN